MSTKVHVHDYNAIFIQALRDIMPQLSLHSNDRIEKKIGKDRLEDAAINTAGLIAVGTRQLFLTKNEQLALTSQVLGCLERYISEDLQIPVTLKTFVDNISVLNYAVDKSFPGYIKSGQLGVIIKPRSIANADPVSRND